MNCDGELTLCLIPHSQILSSYGSRDLVKPVKPVYPVATLEKLDLFRSMEVLFPDFL